MRTFHSFEEIAKESGDCLLNIWHRFLNNYHQTAYIYTDNVLLEIPRSILNQIYSEIGMGMKSHAIDIRHPFLKKQTTEGIMYLSEEEFQQEVQPDIFESYLNARKRNESYYPKNMSTPFEGELKIRTQESVTQNEILVCSKSEFARIELNVNPNSQRFIPDLIDELHNAALANSKLNTKNYRKFATDLLVEKFKPVEIPNDKLNMILDAAKPDYLREQKWWENI